MTHDVAVHVHAADPPAAHFNEWTQERIDILVQLRDANMKRGTIAATINKQTGSRFSTNAVCGKIDRMFPHSVKHRLTDEERAASEKRSREKNVAKQRETRKKKRAELGLPEDIRWCRPPFKVQPLAVVVFDPAVFTDANVHGLVNLEKHHCHYPLNDDMSQPIYCGCPTLDGSSYCSGHHAICWLPPRGRKEPGRVVP